MSDELSKEIKTFFQAVKFESYIRRMTRLAKKIEKLKICNPDKLDIKVNIEIDGVLMSHIHEIIYGEYSREYTSNYKINTDEILKKWNK